MKDAFETPSTSTCTRSRKLKPPLEHRAQATIPTTTSTTYRRRANDVLQFWCLLSILRRTAAFSLPRRIQHQTQRGLTSNSFEHSIENQVQQESLSNDYLMKRLEKYGFSKRLLTIESSDLPVVAEVHHDGHWSLGHITSFQLPTKPGDPPRVQVQLQGMTSVMMMDLGQVTSIWKHHSCEFSPDWQTQMDRAMDAFPVRHSEHAMQRLYSTSLAHQDSGGLTKKAVNQMIQGAPEENRVQTGEVLRRLVKTGKSMGRLVDYEVAAKYLFDDTFSGSWLQCAVGGHLLAKDAELGGRFKRWPCTAISLLLEDGTAGISIGSVSLINGGWLLLDESVRAGTEARKFAERTDGPLRTVADERIAHRLECLAMGQIFESTVTIDEDREMEIDVREALRAMQLPISPDGAQEALVRIGRWSKDSKNVKLEPWSRGTLEAAKWYANMDSERRLKLNDAPSNDLEGRLDLRNIPCVCVDAERTAFRDDAIGIRPRSMTGRKVVSDASKWELLIHIADVSDIYTSNSNSRYTSLLQEAATNRGMSRYDLPLGPLHLMPPVALRAMSLDIIKVDPSTSPSSMTEGVNRCVTIWAYIDERTGKILDAGVERSLISKPISLSFAEATTLLETNPQLGPRHPLMVARSVISTIDRILALWRTHQTENSSSAKKREERLAVRELVAKEQNKGFQGRDDGTNGFQRTRGHRLVDTALDLHGFALLALLRRAKAPIPMASGTKDGRTGTAPLRRFVDGMVQRQAVSVLCNFGGPPLTIEDCRVVNQQMDQARNNLSNLSATKDPRVVPVQVESLRALQSHLLGKPFRVLSAMSTGRENEVTIEGIGAIAKCKGVAGTLKPGAKVNVMVEKLNPEKGILVVTLVSTRE